MPKHRLILTAALVFAGAAAPFAAGQTDTAQPAKTTEAAAQKKLVAGDKAPPLSVEKWVKGEPITGFEKGRVYVVEFWATWCGPCVASMPHLSALQKEYKGKVTIIGVTKADANNSLDQVEKMVKDKGEGMGYTVAWDKGSETYNAYMKAAGQNGIPCSYVVDGTGTVAYIGHPMFLDTVLDGVTKGKWDPKTDSAKLAEAEKLNATAWAIVDPAAKVEKRDLDKAMAAATKAAEITREKDPAILDTLAWVYFHKGDTTKAVELEKKAIALASPEMKAELEGSLKKFQEKKN